MTVSAFDHPLLASLVGDDEVAASFSLAAEIEAMLAFERALAAAEAETGIIGADAATDIAAAIDRFAPDMASLRKGMERDGVAVPNLVRQLREAVGEGSGRYVHLGATSQDVVDTGLILRLAPIVKALRARLALVDDGLAGLQARFGEHRLKGITRMQPALTITVTDRIAAWRQPLRRHADRLRKVGTRLLVVQLGGAVGTLDGLGASAAAVRAALARRLGLGDAPQWHSQRDAIADFAGWLSLVTASLGKIGQDIALMALDGSAIRLSGSGGSSAMPHKQNPVKAEILEALARYNAAQVSAIHQASIHPFERSGAAWTLEWLILPQMVVATAAALRLAITLIGDIETMGS